MKNPQSINFTDLNLKDQSGTQREAYIKSFSQRTGEQAGQLIANFLDGILSIFLADRSRSSSRSPIIPPSFVLSSTVPPKSEILLTAYEIAIFLNISKAKTYQLISGEEIPSVKFGRTTRVRKEDLELFVKHHIVHDR
jgi:excisionase family DNA binding protein